jgi:hypothetical protein
MGTTLQARGEGIRLSRPIISTCDDRSPIRLRIELQYIRDTLPEELVCVLTDR